MSSILEAALSIFVMLKETKIGKKKFISVSTCVECDWNQYSKLPSSKTLRSLGTLTCTNFYQGFDFKTLENYKGRLINQRSDHVSVIRLKDSS